MEKKYKNHILQITIYLIAPNLMASSLSNLVNLAEGIHKIKCKYGHDNKKCKGCECCLEYTSVEDDLIE